MTSRHWLMLIPVLVAPDFAGAQAALLADPAEVRVDLRFLEVSSDRVEGLHMEGAPDAQVDDGRWALAVGRFQPFVDLRLALDGEPDGFRTLSAPRVRTHTGRGVVVHQRSRYRVRSVGAQGAEERWATGDLEARITPRLRPDGSVLLDLDLRRDEPEQEGTLMIERRAQIQIVVAEGEAAYVRGMVATGDFAHREGASGVPMLGRLFRPSRAAEDRAELLMFVAPRVVR